MKLLPALLFSALLPFAARAETKVNISQFTLGKTISGTEVTAETVKGKPVLIEFWGINCAPCLAHMPMFNALSKRYDSKGLVVIGAHSQSATDAEILEKVKSTKVKFPVTTGTHGPVQFNGIPHSLIFGADGVMLFQGSPDDKEFDRALRLAIKDAPPSAAPETGKAKPVTSALSSGPLVPERTWTNTDGKPLAAALLSVTGGQGKFRRRDGSIFSYAIEKLSSADQEIIAGASAPKTGKNAKAEQP
ncbi:MAG: TlpA disulfide reductase family protein [Verrucomicrobiota bacterium]